MGKGKLGILKDQYESIFELGNKVPNVESWANMSPV